MKIAFIINDLSFGGSEKNTLNLSYYFAKKTKQSTHLIVFKNKLDIRSEESDFNKYVKIINLTNYKDDINILLKPIYYFSVLLNLYKLINKEKYDILTSETQCFTYYFTVVFGKLFKIKTVLVAAINFSAFFNKRSTLFRLIHYLPHWVCFMLTDKIISVTRGVKLDLIKNHKISEKKIKVIFYGIKNAVIIKKSMKKIGKKIEKEMKKNNFIINIGRLTPQKGHLMLLEIFSLIRQKTVNVKLMIIGSGENNKQIQKFIESNNLKKDVFLIKETNNPFKYLPKAKLYFCSSIWEGFNLAIIEAMACGLPIISTDCFYGPKEILFASNTIKLGQTVKKISYGKYGILIPPKTNETLLINEKEAIVNLIKKLLIDQKLYSKYVKKSLIRSKFFNFNKSAVKYYQEFNNLLK